ncbi:MAG: hypothetical protein ACOYNN_16460 [Terrimicrobiaceae bacterium]
MGKALGTIAEAETKGDRSIGDLSFFASAHIAPDGDLAKYVMSFAKESPDMFGLSIVFAHDPQAETEFALAHGAEMDVDDDGYPFVNYTNFVSPDELNTENLPHCRLAELRACDVVDEPAANPGGLFHRHNELLSDGSKVQDYVFGRSEKLGQVQALSALGLNVAPERLKSFVSQYLAAAGLTLSMKGAAMAVEKKPVEDEKEKKPMASEDMPEKEMPEDETAPPEDDAPEIEDEDEEAAEKAGEKKYSGKPDGTLKEYCEAFGFEDGAKFFLQGKSFKAAQTEQIKSLKAQIKDRDEKLAAIATLGVDPVAFTAAKDAKRDETNRSALSQAAEPVDPRAAFAAAIAKPETAK